MSQHWKEAAAQEAVDYGAVEKSFMNQAYGFVANKARALFRDPFRLGFEIVHRNEKATKMVGIFGFRVGTDLLFAPVFFINGEIKGADLLYRHSVKRFVPLDEDWCQFLVQGASAESGTLVDRNRHVQRDSHMERLAYPQSWGVKSAAIWADMLEHAADDTAVPLLLPQAVSDGGPATLEKLAAMIEESDAVANLVNTTYTTEQLSNVDGWLAKQAAAELPELEVQTDFTQVKSAAERDKVFKYGYNVIDYREPSKLNYVTEEINNEELTSATRPGVLNALTADGETTPLAVFAIQSWCSGYRPPISGTRPEKSDLLLYAVKDGQAKRIASWDRARDLPFGSYGIDTTPLTEKAIDVDKATTGKAYVLADVAGGLSSDILYVCDKTTKNGATILTLGYSDFRPRNHTNITYKADAAAADPESGLVNAHYKLLPIDLKVEGHASDDHPYHTPTWEQALMSGPQLDQWLRTAGGVTHSHSFTLSKRAHTDDYNMAVDGTIVLKGLDRQEMQLKLASGWGIAADTAADIIDAADKATTKRVVYVNPHEGAVKAAYTTRLAQRENFQTYMDPEMGVQIDYPREQRLNTTSQRPQQQQARGGDRYINAGHGTRNDSHGEDEMGLPGDALMSMSPDQLASTASQMDMPHVFDHGVIGSLAGSVFDSIEQVKQYIPALEQGVDRYGRILFLLRYRPADFEEAYGKDEVMEMEGDLSVLFKMSGASLLRLLKRFDSDKFKAQTLG